MDIPSLPETTVETVNKTSDQIAIDNNSDEKLDTSKDISESQTQSEHHEVMNNTDFDKGRTKKSYSRLDIPANG